MVRVGRLRRLPGRALLALTLPSVCGELQRPSVSLAMALVVHVVPRWREPIGCGSLSPDSLHTPAKQCGAAASRLTRVVSIACQHARVWLASPFTQTWRDS